MSVGEDFRTVERLEEYKAAGMTIYLPQSAGAYGGEAWSISEAKKAMDNALAAGIDKVILTDTRIQEYSMIEGGLIGEGKKFATEAALDNQIAKFMANYRSHAAFYGVMLGDEPRYYQFESYGQVYRSIKRVCPEAFVQCNLNPCVTNASTDWYPDLDVDTTGWTNEEIIAAKFEKYLTMFLDATDADYFMYDQYPFKDYSMGKNTAIYREYILGLQVAAKLAAERGVKFYIVTQTMRMVENLGTENELVGRYMDEQDARWLNNMLLGFGVKEIAYFTYWTKQGNTTSTYFYDNGSFVNRDGTLTDLYYIMQEVMAENQQLAPTILNYEYSTSNLYTAAGYSAPTYVTHAQEGEAFKKVESVSTNREVALVTELYDDEKDLYMYMVMNATDPDGTTKTQSVTVDFADEYTHAVLFVNGERSVVELGANGVYTFTHVAGDATYVIPYTE